jgi:hypothetical protein
MIYKFLFYIFLLFSLFSCSKTDPVTNEKVLIETNPQIKAKKFAEAGGGIFGDINNKKSSGTNFEFASSNVLWRATLKSLDFLPLVNADYSGGIIIFDWYSDASNNNQIKVTIRFLSNELRSESLQVNVHKKICDENNKCTTKMLVDSFPNEIKDKILSAARILRIEEEKNKKSN